MKDRFEIPLPNSKSNIFAIDDFIRRIRSPEEREKLITSVGFSKANREAFEEMNGLPFGAVELAMLANDKKVNDLQQSFLNKLQQNKGQGMRADEMREIYAEAESASRGLKTIYPDAFQFLVQYALLSHRNKVSFQGDFGFSNDAKVIQAQCPPWFVDTEVLVTTNLGVQGTVFLNLGYAANVYVIGNVALAVALVFVIYVQVCIPISVPSCI